MCYLLTMSYISLHYISFVVQSFDVHIFLDNVLFCVYSILCVHSILSAHKKLKNRKLAQDAGPTSCLFQWTIVNKQLTKWTKEKHSKSTQFSSPARFQEVLKIKLLHFKHLSIQTVHCM